MFSQTINEEKLKVTVLGLDCQEFALPALLTALHGQQDESSSIAVAVDSLLLSDTKQGCA